MIKRILVKKNAKLSPIVQEVENEFKEFLQIKNLDRVEIINQYLVDGLDDEELKEAVDVIFSEPPLDVVLNEIPDCDNLIATELLPGQFDMRASSAVECISLLFPGKKADVRCATLYLIYGKLTNEEIDKCKRHLINPVEMREASTLIPKTLDLEIGEVEHEIKLDNFDELTKDQLITLIEELSLSMDIDDVLLCQEYFKKQNRQPTLTEIKVIDTYWSDHCRHTTFNTNLKDIKIDDENIYEAYERYQDLRKELDRENTPITLMDLGTIAARALKSRGILNNVDESDEINACTVNVKVDVGGELQDWLYLFKNETHNHPTEIEPFGGAATCVGGAIRDPLSGRSYVYQAMRISGAGNPLQKVEDTIKGKLPQRKICKSAAEGFSSYGNQIGLATGLVDEIYHPGYTAKRMEIGAVVGAVKKDSVVRSTPKSADVVILLGGRTGRDGIGGATGSSKSHKVDSILKCGSEVQKGNAPTERKIQRLFKNPEVTKMIARCNDFGAGGVSIAIGELADGLEIQLDKVPLKYKGLNPTEIAISESQERMACVVSNKDAEKFIEYANEENLEATIVASITDDRKFVLKFKDDIVCELERDFLDENGAKKTNNVYVPKIDNFNQVTNNASFKEKFMAMVSELNVCSKQGLSSMFDSTIGASNVIFPYGGKFQKTPSISMVSKLPTGEKSSTVSGMSWGFNPNLSEINPYKGGYFAVIDSITKLVCTGFSRHDAYLSLQEYFKKLGSDPKNWGLVFSTLLGALDAQMDIEVAAIGGKDSMSGTFDDLSVPPTLVSFATALSEANVIISPEFKETNSSILLITPESKGDKLDANSVRACLDTLNELIVSGKILSASTPSYCGCAESIFKMCLGNKIGFSLDPSFDGLDLFKMSYGSFILEVKEQDAQETINKFNDAKFANVIGKTTNEFIFSTGDEAIDLDGAQKVWESVLNDVYPQTTYLDESEEKTEPISKSIEAKTYSGPNLLGKKPKVIIPIFPGTNCEFDTTLAFEEAGAEVETYVIKDLTPSNITNSIDDLSKLIDNSQILMIPGGFSGADEPDGSAKLISSFFRSNKISESISKLLEEKDGLILGICNGFQALLKLGLLPYGKITTPKKSDPVLCDNLIGHHQSNIVNTIVTSTLSPWMSKLSIGEIYKVPISHGQGRFMCDDEMLQKLIDNGQVCAQYVDDHGSVLQNTSINPNGSIANIEAICSVDGRILGKMGHSERKGEALYKNVCGNTQQKLFESGVSYFL